MRTALIVLLLLTSVRAAGAQARDSTRTPAVGARFTGQINSFKTSKPVTTADIRLIWVDSVHTDSTKTGAEATEFFLDSARSKVGITNDSGTFAINNVAPGSYLLHVRRIGFDPVQALIKMGTSTIEMKLAMEQAIAILPEVKITTEARDRVAERLERVGFSMRAKTGSATIINREEILRRNPVFVTDLLEKYGVRKNAEFTMDRMETDWDNLSTYPADLVVGVEIYRRRASLPSQFDRTRRSGLTMSYNGIEPYVVMIWTYIP